MPAKDAMKDANTDTNVGACKAVTSGGRLEDDNKRNENDPPTQLYTAGDKRKRKRLYPCQDCGDNADGSHQCGGCFQHMHAICGAAYPRSCEGHGQKRLCHNCVCERYRKRELFYALKT